MAAVLVVLLILPASTCGHLCSHWTSVRQGVEGAPSPWITAPQGATLAVQQGRSWHPAHQPWSKSCAPGSRPGLWISIMEAWREAACGPLEAEPSAVMAQAGNSLLPGLESASPSATLLLGSRDRPGGTVWPYSQATLCLMGWSPQR